MRWGGVDHHQRRDDQEISSSSPPQASNTRLREHTKSTILQETIETTRPKVSNTEVTQHRSDVDASPWTEAEMRRLPQANKAQSEPAQFPGLPRGHRREHKALGEFLLPRYPSEGFPIIDPLPLPFLTLEPLRVEGIHLELVEMIRRRRRVNRRHEPRDLATYSRCCFHFAPDKIPMRSGRNGGSTGGARRSSGRVQRYVGNDVLVSRIGISVRHAHVGRDAYDPDMQKA